MRTADRIATLVREVTGSELPLRLRTWDGSEAGPAGGPVLVVHSRLALRRILWRPGQLGLAQAYLAGEIDVDGDLTDGLRQLWRHAEQQPRVRVRLKDSLRYAGVAVRLGVLGPRPGDPLRAAEPAGPLHGRRRDRAAIAYHYDQSNDLFRLILDSRMTYSCAYFAPDGPDRDLEEAQRDKLDLICRKLALRPGMRLLDVGCGWGALAIHSATHYGVSVTGVTLSSAQHEFALARAADLGLTGKVDIRLQDYRDAGDGPYDAVSCIEMGEHVGASRYPKFARQLRGLLAPGGRLLLQQMSRSGHAPSGGSFIESYVAPDLYMRPTQQTLGLLAESGLDVHDVQPLGEHYARTIRCWQQNLEKHWAQVVGLVGEPAARVWRLYLAGAALDFELGRTGVDQVLAVRP